MSNVDLYISHALFKNIIQTHDICVARIDDTVVVIDLDNRDKQINILNLCNADDLKSFNIMNSKRSLELYDHIFTPNVELFIRRAEILSEIALESSRLFDAVSSCDFLVTGEIKKCVYGGRGSNRTYNCGWMAVSAIGLLSGAAAVVRFGIAPAARFATQFVTKAVTENMTEAVGGAFVIGVKKLCDSGGVNNSRVVDITKMINMEYEKPAGDGRTREYRKRIIQDMAETSRGGFVNCVRTLSDLIDTGHIFDMIISDDNSVNFNAMLECIDRCGSTHPGE